MSSEAVKSSLRRLDRGLQRAGEGGWVGVFAAARRLARPARARWSTEGGQRVLVVAPHPDDEVAGCAGAIARHVRSGDEVAIVWVTGGGLSRALGLAPAVMVRRRREEACAAAAALGVEDATWLGLPEGGWRPAHLRAPLARLLAGFAPSLVYAPSLVDFHPEHLRVARVLAAVLAGLPAGLLPPVVRVYQMQVPLTPALVNLVADVSGVQAACRRALEAYVTQQDSLLRTYRQRRYEAALYGCPALAEPFWEMTALRYSRQRHEPEGPCPYRALRFRPWSDPLAYLVGRRARRALARRLEQASAGEEGPAIPALRLPEPFPFQQRRGHVQEES